MLPKLIDLDSYFKYLINKLSIHYAGFSIANLYIRFNFSSWYSTYRFIDDIFIINRDCEFWKTFERINSKQLDTETEIDTSCQTWIFSDFWTTIHNGVFFHDNFKKNTQNPVFYNLHVTSPQKQSKHQYPEVLRFLRFENT